MNTVTRIEGKAAVNFCDALSAVHQRAFAGSSMRGWRGAEIAELCESHGVSVYMAQSPTGQIIGFAMMRIVCDEAELLTIAVDPAHRNGGIGRRLLNAVVADAKVNSVARMLLEVVQSNTAAMNIYSSCGFRQVGERKCYSDGGAFKDNASIMELLTTR